MSKSTRLPVLRSLGFASVLIASVAISGACSKSAGLTASPGTVAVSAQGGLRASFIHDPSEPIRVAYVPGEITRICSLAIESVTKRLDVIAAIPATARTFDNTVLEFESATADFSDAVQPVIFMDSVSLDHATSDEASACDEKVGEFSVAIMTRKDVYNAIRDMKPRNAEEGRLLKMTLKGFESNGLKLSDDILAKVRELKQKIALDQSRFGTNLNHDVSTITFSGQELDGVSPDFLARLKKTADGSFLVTTKETDYTYVMKNAKNGETRRKMLLAYQSRAATENTKLLEDAIVLREEVASLMGYQTWADYQIDGRMAKDGATVLSFLNSLKDKLAQRNRDDLDKLLKFKQQAEPNVLGVNAWDISYLADQVMKRDYSLDEESIREYFSASTVIPGMFDLYSRLFGVRFVRVENGRTWAPGVDLYRTENPENGNLIAYFYFDLYPRAGKYSHSAAFPLLSARRMSDGTYSVPVASIVANVSPPSNGKPALFTHDDLETLFHEFGHIMHMTLTRAPYASLSGANVAQDFVETPSQLMENWTFSPEIMTAISGHYLDSSRKIPVAFIRQILAAKNFNQGYNYTRQVMLALLDMTYHTAHGPVDTTQVMNNLYRTVIGIEPLADAHFQAGFGHLMGGYDAGYYSYLWSEVYAADIFSVFDRVGLMNRDEGLRYRHMILENGNMTDAMDLLRQFLGREPSQDGFLKKLGIGSM